MEPWSQNVTRSPARLHCKLCTWSRYSARNSPSVTETGFPQQLNDIWGLQCLGSEGKCSINIGSHHYHPPAPPPPSSRFGGCTNGLHCNGSHRMTLNTAIYSFRDIYLFIYLFFFFGHTVGVYGILVPPSQGIEPTPLAVEAQVLTPGLPREVPRCVKF